MSGNDRRIGTGIAAATCGLLGAAAPVRALAQDASPTWDIDSAVLYYGESDSRVQDASFAIDAHRDLGDDRALSLAAHFDTLSGASPNGAAPGDTPQTFTSPSGRSTYTTAAGVVPLDNTFHDTRLAVDAGWSQSFARLYKLNAGLSASTEYDYQHFGLNLGLSRDFDRRNTTLSASVAFGLDTVKPIGGLPVALATMPDSVGEEGSAASRAGSSDNKNVLDLLLGVTQVLGRHSLLRVNYSYSDSNGYLTDPYKVLSVVDPVSGELVPRTPAPGSDGPLGVYRFESRPDSRRRQGVYAEFRQDFSARVLQLDYRYSTDDWDIRSSTAEVRLRLPFGSSNYLEPHLRFYTQTAASFYRYSLSEGEPLPLFASADARLGQFAATTVGLKFGHTTAEGNEWNARLELYRQTGKLPTTQLVGAQLNNALLPNFDAVILQVGYRFKY